MRKEFEMTREQLQILLDAGKPRPYIVVGGVEPISPQESANHAWEDLGKILGFDSDTVERIDGRGDRFFTAEVKEMEMQWWLISKEDADRIRQGLLAPTHEANDYNCEDWPPGSGCKGCKGDHLREEALHALDSGLHTTDTVPEDFKEEEKHES